MHTVCTSPPPAYAYCMHIPSCICILYARPLKQITPRHSAHRPRFLLSYQQPRVCRVCRHSLPRRPQRLYADLMSWTAHSQPWWARRYLWTTNLRGTVYVYRIRLVFTLYTLLYNSCLYLCAIVSVRVTFILLFNRHVNGVNLLLYWFVIGMKLVWHWYGLGMVLNGGQAGCTSAGAKHWRRRRGPRSLCNIRNLTFEPSLFSPQFPNYTKTICTKYGNHALTIFSKQ